MALFSDREEAGRKLAAQLDSYSAHPGVLVLGMAPKAVPIAYEVARHLKAPLDVYSVEEITVASEKVKGESLGAVTSGGEEILDYALLSDRAISDASLQVAIGRAKSQIESRENAYRDGQPRLPVTGQTVILVDDGLSDPRALRAACVALRRQEVGRLVVALPAAFPETQAALEGQADEVVFVTAEHPVPEAQRTYTDPYRGTEEEVRELLRRSHAKPGATQA